MIFITGINKNISCHLPLPESCIRLVVADKKGITRKSMYTIVTIPYGSSGTKRLTIKSIISTVAIIIRLNKWNIMYSSLLDLPLKVKHFLNTLAYHIISVAYFEGDFPVDCPDN